MGRCPQHIPQPAMAMDLLSIIWHYRYHLDNHSTNYNTVFLASTSDDPYRTVHHYLLPDTLCYKTI